ncbi:MAG: copper-binding protein [Sphingomonas sp.]|jgi:plastocyanin|uniref:copper-binding protein n=1 Tax=Sphingomonas sp. TaxID=28214 RepID=UPI0035689F67
MIGGPGRHYRDAACRAALLVVACVTLGAAVPVPDWLKPERVDVTLRNFAFAPSELRLRAGHVYQLHFANVGSGGHDFTAPDFFRAANIRDGDRPGVAGGKVSLRKGEVRDVLLVPAAGTYPLKCGHFLHASLGMTGMIVVE